VRAMRVKARDTCPPEAASAAIAGATSTAPRPEHTGVPSEAGRRWTPGRDQSELRPRTGPADVLFLPRNDGLQFDVVNVDTNAAGAGHYLELGLEALLLQIDGILELLPFIGDGVLLEVISGE